MSDKLFTLAELEDTFMNGFADAVTGDTDAPTNHVYMVGRQLVETCAQGFQRVHDFSTETEAEKEFDRIDEEYSAWEDAY